MILGAAFSKQTKKRFAPRVRALCKFGTALSLCVAPPVFAAGALEEVIVTARKREENLQALPQAITALQSDQLETAQVSNIQNLENIVPNVTMGDSASIGAASTLNAVVRGIGNESGFAPGVGIYIDDVYLATAYGAVLDVYDIERVEVLKGPQGNLYGRNTIGGAIRYITRDPSDETRATVEAKIGSFNRRDESASVSGPLVDNFLYGGIAVARKKQDGYQKNLADGQKFGSADSWSGRGTLKLTPTDDFSAKWVTDYYYDTSKPKQGRRIYTSPAYAAGTPSDPTNDASTVGKNEVSFSLVEPLNWYARTMTHALTLSWDISEQWAVKSVSAYRYVASRVLQDLDGSLTPGLDTTQTRRDTSRSQEFQFNYTGDGMDGVIGYYYFKEREENPLTTIFFPSVAGGLTFSRDGFAVTDNVSKALYTSWDFDLSDSWHFTAGARRNWDRSEAEFSQTEFYPVLPLPPTYTTFLFNQTIDYGTTPFANSWNKFTKTFRLAYDLSPDTMAYMGYAEGYKQGGFNTTGGALAIALGKTGYDPENVKTYTLGFKTTQLNNTLRLNAEWFYNDYRDKLLRTVQSNPVDPTRLLQINENAGAVHTTGFDLDATWSTPIDGLVIGGSVGYLQAVIDSYKASQWNSTGTALVNPEQSSAYRMGYTPRWTASLSPVYTLPLTDLGKLQFAATANYRDKSYVISPTNLTRGYANAGVSDARTMYNASIAWTSASEAWRLALEGRNLSNVRVLTDGFDVGANLFALGSYNDPRTWAASVRYTYR